MGNKTIKIDWDQFEMAINTDVEYHNPGQVSYLDTETGEIEFMYADDIDSVDSAENKMIKEIIASDEKRYLEIPGLTHADAHYILLEFLNSDWTDDMELKQKVKNCYLSSYSCAIWQ